MSDDLRLPIAALVVVLILLGWTRLVIGEWPWQDDSGSMGTAHFSCADGAPTNTYRVQNTDGTWSAFHTVKESVMCR